MEDPEEGINDNGNIYVKQDEIVNNFVESLVTLRMILEVVDTVIQLYNAMQVKEQDFKNKEFYSFNSVEEV